ncbi:MAG: permease-like cell division protein FtsX [Oscillospiraceae bacterium]
MRGSSFGYLIKQGIKSVYVNRVMSFAAIGVLIACMLLIGSSMLLSYNVNGIVGYIEDQNEVVAFLNMELSSDEKKDIDDEINALTNVNKVLFISGKDGLIEWFDTLGDDSVYLEGLEEEKILPDSYRLMLDDLSILDETVKKLESIDGVDKVIAPIEVAKTLTNVKSAVFFCGMFIVGILVAVSFVIIGNTIKITVFNRRKEINIMKMVGATDIFIRLPFFIEGLLLGVISATISFFLLWGGYELAFKWLNENSVMWVSSFQSNMVLFNDIALKLYLELLLGGTFVGTAGSMIFVRKYLRV